MINAFAAYERQSHVVPDIYNQVHMTPGTRLYHITRLPHGWRIWLATRDLIHGTYMELHNDGCVTRWECRPDEGDEHYVVRPNDAAVAIKSQLREPAPRSGAQQTTSGAQQRHPTDDEDTTDV